MIDKPLEMLKYYEFLQEELLHKKKLIDLMIDKNQKYPRGILLEEMTRELLKDALPSDLAVGQGFIYHAGRKSPQCDILIYYSSRYAPFLSVNDLVVVPPAAVAAVLEVKTKLTSKRLDETLDCFKQIRDFSAESIGHDNIRKYIVAFDAISLQTLSRSEKMVSFPEHLNAIVILGKGLIYKTQSKPYKPEAVRTKDTLFYLIVNLISSYAFWTRANGAASNPYEAYVKHMSGDRIDLG